MFFSCPPLGSDVELTDERRAHVEQRHPEIVHVGWDAIYTAAEDPDCILTDRNYPQTWLLVQWREDVLRGKYVVAVIRQDDEPSRRFWLVTAYISRKPPSGEVTWKRP